MSTVTLTKDNFQSEVLASSRPVLIDFWAPWCAPCRMLSPMLDSLAEELDGEVVVGKVNVDEQQELAAAFRVASIPTLAVVKEGVVTAAAAGVRPKEEILKMLEG